VQARDWVEAGPGALSAVGVCSDSGDGQALRALARALIAPLRMHKCAICFDGG
jgi:hypothetical protein